MPNSLRLAALADSVAVVGVGDTDYAVDYQRARDKQVDKDAYGYAALAFKRALADAGVACSDIDGLIAGPTLAGERLGEVLGIDPRWSAQGDAVNAIMQAAIAIHSGFAECIALVYGNNQRSKGTQYGGPRADGGERYLAYVYYAPWGMTSQGALYALMTQRYMALHGLKSENLGEIAMAQRRFAKMNDNAIMRAPLTTAEYLAGRFICEPLRLFDYCLVNDGGVAMIMTTAERARRMAKTPVLVSGVGRSDINSGATSLQPRLIDFYHTGHRQTAAQVFDMAGVGPGDIDLVQIYDSFSVHVLFALEGFGYCPVGEAGQFIANGAIGPGGRLPINTSGGHLSEAYMQGWNHQVEIVRQLRREAGARQVEGARHAQYISDVAGKVASVIYKREGS
ncbi:MAG: thiolase family protein [Betaproteobacteria bacterium]|nr:thiolase family protein [Betaproteobacteria bacterium]